MLKISWVEQQQIVAKKFYTITPMGILITYVMADTILKTEWNLDDLVIVESKNRHCRQLQAYLENPLTDLKVNLQKQGSLYQNKVWSEICKIPVAEVKSYSDIANAIGSGARAVANACRVNPFPAIIPCHRVVSVSGLGGYMGETSGQCIEIKKKLLEIESHFQPVNSL